MNTTIGPMIAVLIALAEARQGPKNFVVVLQGTAAGVVVDDFDGFEGIEFTCFDVDLADPATGFIRGSATDCLELGSMVPIGDDGGFGINNLTFFDLPGGTLVSLSRTTIQPVEDPSFGPTHITGEVSTEDNIVGDLSTGRFDGAEGTTRLSGAVDMSLFGSGVITFDCMFVIHVD